jgi:hypothetical protein
VRGLIGTVFTPIKVLVDSINALQLQHIDLSLDYACAYQGFNFFKKSIGLVCGILFDGKQNVENYIPKFCSKDINRRGFVIKYASAETSQYFTVSDDHHTVIENVASLAQLLWINKFKNEKLQFARQSYLAGTFLFPMNITMSQFFGAVQEEEDSAKKKKKRFLRKAYKKKERNSRNKIKKEIKDYILINMGTPKKCLRNILEDMLEDCDDGEESEKSDTDEDEEVDESIPGGLSSDQYKQLKSAIITEDVLFALQGIRSNYTTFTSEQKHGVVFLYENILNFLHSPDCVIDIRDDKETLAASLVTDILQNTRYRKNGYSKISSKLLQKWAESSIKTSKERGCTTLISR